MKSLFAIVLLIVAVLFIALSASASHGKQTYTNLSQPIILKCADGTPFERCSTKKPLLCSNGVLVNDCGKCGCEPNSFCGANGQCIFDYSQRKSGNDYVKLMEPRPCVDFVPKGVKCGNIYKRKKALNHRVKLKSAGSK